MLVVFDLGYDLSFESLHLWRIEPLHYNKQRSLRHLPAIVYAKSWVKYLNDKEHSNQTFQVNQNIVDNIELRLKCLFDIAFRPQSIISEIKNFLILKSFSFYLRC